MAVLNGRIPDSMLAPIAGGRLRKDAAKAWNAMNAESKAKYGIVLRPTGSMSSYRTYAQQVYLYNLYLSGKGNLAARPGTSNHGAGLAVDLATPQMRSIVDKIGRKYGFAKAWSDAQSEWWHIKWKVGNYPAVNNSPAALPTLKQGQVGPSVIKLKKLLYDNGIRGFSTTPTGKESDNRYNPYFSANTTSAVKRFQKAHGLSPDGIVGPSTWKKLQG